MENKFHLTVRAACAALAILSCAAQAGAQPLQAAHGADVADVRPADGNGGKPRVNWNEYLSSMEQQAMAQGTNRFDRFRKFESYLTAFPKWSEQVSFHVFEGLGHDSAAAYRDPALIAYIVDGL